MCIYNEILFRLEKRGIFVFCYKMNGHGENIAKLKKKPDTARKLFYLLICM
jgi:hypothetical protein